MPRKKIESISGGLPGDFQAVSAEVPEASDEEAKRKEEEALAMKRLEEAKEEVGPLLSELFQTNAAVKRNKELKDKIKSILIEGQFREVDCGFGVAKIVDQDASSLNEEALIEDLKGAGFGSLVKTKTVTYVDMDGLEKAMYEEDGNDDTPLTDLVRKNTSHDVVKKLTTSEAKQEKPKKTKKGGK